MGRAYYCFETGEELEKLRKQAEKEKKGFVYQRPAVLPTEADVEKAKAEGKPVTIRFAMPEGTKSSSMTLFAARSVSIQPNSAILSLSKAMASRRIILPA